MAVTDLFPAFFQQCFNCVGILVCLNIETRRCRKCAFFNHAVDGQHGIKVERVCIQTGQGQLGGAGNIVLPNFIGLIGQAEHQIGHNHGIELAQFCQIFKRLVAAVFAAETAADGGIEGLHADGNAVGPCFETSLCFFQIEMAHAPFDGELAVFGKRQILIAGTNQADDVFRKQCGRRTAPEINSSDFALACTNFGFSGHFFDNFVGVHAALAILPRITVEAAEHAMVGAKWNMQISKRIHIGGMGKLFLPNVLPLGTRHWNTAPNGH